MYVKLRVGEREVGEIYEQKETYLAISFSPISFSSVLPRSFPLSTLIHVPIYLLTITNLPQRAMHVCLDRPPPTCIPHNLKEVDSHLRQEDQQKRANQQRLRDICL